MRPRTPLKRTVISPSWKSATSFAIAIGKDEYAWSCRGTRRNARRRGTHPPSCLAFPPEADWQSLGAEGDFNGESAGSPECKRSLANRETRSQRLGYHDGLAILVPARPWPSADWRVASCAPRGPYRRPIQE